jgi:hypothetical protein
MSLQSIESRVQYIDTVYFGSKLFFKRVKKYANLNEQDNILEVAVGLM